MAARERTVEKAAHIDEQRMRHISDEDLGAALALPQAVGARRGGRRGPQAEAPVTTEAWARYFAKRERPVPVTNVWGWAQRVRLAEGAQAERVIDQATRLHSETVDYVDPSKGKSGLYGFHYMQWMRPLVDAYALTRDEAHARTFARLFNAWYEARDRVKGEWPMDVVWYTLGLAIRSTLFTLAYHTFRGSAALDMATQARLLKAILGAGRWLAEEHDTYRYSNWQLHGVTHLLQLALFWPEFREAPAWRAVAEARLWDHLALDVYPDRGHHERSSGYHSGVVENYGQCALALNLAGDSRLRRDPRVRGLYHWLVQQCSPAGWAPAWNDSGFVWVGPIAARGAVICEDPELRAAAESWGTQEEIAGTLALLPTLPDGRTALQAWNALDRPNGRTTSGEKQARLGWDRPNGRTTSGETGPGWAESVLLPTSKFAVMRSGGGPEDLYLAASYGPWIEHELESHSHNDPLSFVCAGLGAPLAVEAGGPATYDDPSYYEWYQAARAHNVVLVGEEEPGEAHDTGDAEEPDTHQRDGELAHWSTSPVADLFAAEHQGYRKSKGVAHRRTILFARGGAGTTDGYWIVRDELEQRGGTHRFEWLLHLPHEFALSEGAAFPKGGPGLAVWPVAPRGGGLEEGEAGMAQVPGPRAYAGVAERRLVRCVRQIVRSDEPRVALMHVLYPMRAGEGREAVRVESLETGGTPGEACHVHTAAGTDLVLFGGTWGKGEGLDERTANRTAAGGWMIDGLGCLVRADGRWAAWEARSLAHAGVSLFEASSPVTMIAVWPEEGGLAGEVMAQRKTIARVHAPWPWDQVRVNDVVVPQEDQTSQDPCFQFPYEGRFRFAIRKARS